MTKNCKASIGADIPLTPSTEFDGLNDIDRSLLEYGASMASACCNVVHLGDGVEVQGVEYFHGVIAISAAALQTRGTRDAAEILAASVDRLTAMVGAKARCLDRIARTFDRLEVLLAAQIAGNDAGTARPEPPHASVAE